MVFNPFNYNLTFIQMWTSPLAVSPTKFLECQEISFKTLMFITLFSYN